jgi:hypothetical protein
MNRLLMTRLGELESRLDTRFERLGLQPAAGERDTTLGEERVEPPPTARHPL